MSDEQLAKIRGVCRSENVGFDERYVPLPIIVDDLRDARAEITRLREQVRMLREALDVAARRIDSLLDFGGPTSEHLIRNAVDEAHGVLAATAPEGEK